VETVGVEPTTFSLQARRSAHQSFVPKVRTDGVEPSQREAPGLQPGELTCAQRPHGGVADRIRTDAAGITTPGAAVTPQPPRTGTTGFEPAPSRLTSERLNQAYFGERVGVFGIVMGIALLLTGIGFLVLTLGGALERTPEAAKEAAPKPATVTN
jgi:hypothetical protein